MLFLFQMPSPAEGFYWLTCSYNYLLPACVALLWLAILARHNVTTDRVARKRLLLVAALLAFVAVGANETVALPMLLGVVGTTMLRCMQQRRPDWEYVFLSGVVVVACGIAFLAPGNFVRLNQPVRHFTPLECVRHALSAAYRCLMGWLGNGLLLAMVTLLAPIGYRLSRALALPLNRLTRNPFFITLFLPISLVAVLSLGYWTTNRFMPARSVNVLYLFFLVGFFLGAYAWAQFLWRNGSRWLTFLPNYVRWALICWILLVLGKGPYWHIRKSGQPFDANWISVAYQDWLGGAAARYDHQLSKRYEYLRSKPLGAAVVVKPLKDPPQTIFFIDLSPSAEAWNNLAYAEFFGKSTIRIPAEPPAILHPKKSNTDVRSILLVSS